MLQEQKYASADLLDQRAYIAKKNKENFDFSLMVADAFIRGIRDIGYKSTGTALDEFIDNSIQAEAQQVHIVFGYDGPLTKPSALAVIDDGHGMDPDMIRLSIVWGGTHRENNRKGFGRYGYGLPSAAVSQGRRFEVYSLVNGGEWNKNGLDVDEISKGEYTDQAGRVIIPPSKPGTPPSWVDAYIRTHFPSGFAHGTVIVIKKLDKIDWVTTASLEKNLLEHFGITYRNFLRQVSLNVNSKKVEPTDPLFTTPGFRFYDLNPIHAQSYDPLMIDIKDKETREVIGTIKVRYSYFPPLFSKENPDDPMDGDNNERFAIMKDHLGIVVLRMGRQVEVVPTPRDWFVLENNDRYWKIELDFPPTLDEEFSITTSKQTVRLSERIWNALKDAGIQKTISGYRAQYKIDKAKLDELKAEAKVRASEKAMQDAEKFKTEKPAEPSPEESARRQKEFDDLVNKKAKETGQPPAVVRKQLEVEIQGHHYRVDREYLPNAPFYRVMQVGSQKVLLINTAHRFYSELYWSPDASPYFRAALEVLLFSIGDCELDSSDDRKLWYEIERGEWSKRLNVALSKLSKFIDASAVRFESERANEKGQAETVTAR